MIRTFKQRSWMAKSFNEHENSGLARRIYERLFRCPLGKHSRNFEDVRPEGDRFVSKCRGCGVKMLRLSKRNWVVDSRG